MVNATDEKKDRLNSSSPQTECKEIDLALFNSIVGEEIVEFIVNHAPQKVISRFANAADHFGKAHKLVDIDDEMGAIRLIAAEEELVVAIFEWLKLNEEYFPEHKSIVKKFKNHLVKLSFYPVLAQFRWVLADMLRDGFALEGLEGLMNLSVKPIIDGKAIVMALYDGKGKELIRNNLLSIDIPRGDLTGKAVVPELLKDLTETISEQRGISLKQFLLDRADYRNKILYASDGGSMSMDETLQQLLEIFRETYHDLIWALAALIGSRPPSKEWGVVSQFIGMYHAALVQAGALPREVSEEVASV